MRYIVALIFLLFSFSLTSSAQELNTTDFTNAPVVDTPLNEEAEIINQLIIKFKPSISEKVKSEIYQFNNITEISNSKFTNLSLVQMQEDTDLEYLINSLQKYSDILYVEPNVKVKQSYTPKETYYGKQWHLNRLNMPKAWDSSKGSSKVTVAVIDGGVQANHPELKGKIVKPYDITTGNTYTKGDHHGTHVAGIIAASFNKAGTAGIAPNVNIMPINVFKDSSAEMFDIAEAIYYAVYFKADVINLSLVSYQYSDILEEAANYALSEGVILVAAAGNDDSYEPTYPASYKSVLAVSATTSRDRIAGFSNYGTYIDFSAPGDTIYSTNGKSSYQYMSGTSMAAPMVSGITALTLSKNPFISVADVKSILKKSVVDLGLKGWDPLYGYGRIDGYKAIQNTPAPIKSLTISSSTFKVDGKSKRSISFTPHKGTTIDVYVRDSKGTTVKHLIKKHKSTGKKVSASWDGKLENGSYASTGTYDMVVRLSKGDKTAYSKKQVKVDNKITPTITLGKLKTSFSPVVTSKYEIPYKLNKNVLVTAKVYDRKGKLVHTLLSNKSLRGGSQTLSWNGKDKTGKLVADGDYKITLSIIDTRKVKGKSKSVTVKIDKKGPTGVLNISELTFKLGQTGNIYANLQFKEKITMTGYMMDEKGHKIKKLVSKKTISPDEYKLSWNGTNDQNTVVGLGKYQFYIELIDSLGNKTILKSDFITVEDSVITSSPEMIYNLNGLLDVPYSLSKSGQLTIGIYKDNELIKPINNQYVEPGEYSFSWDGTGLNGLVEDGQFYFKIVLKDPTGIENFYVGSILVKR
ncbi:S8 family serine peptidase [Bacillus sp. 31A1R]|uniref:S8 family serine peptidase n=1 Tax=Robertmurraya mangrovi TaxID=3098077 RepID=A0ABU5IXL7_9BACI|nr:S8 family serine peptidase [Bacillus sp. 31A1R]MDZ5471913.1 S8 family serine peptidase [Bacillus sp. 31A1R]